MLEETLDHFTMVTDMYPDNAKGYVNRGNLFVLLDRYEEGLRSYDKALTLDRSNRAAKVNREKILTLLKELK